MNVALKEWAAVIRALESGRQIFLLRKGGLAETSLGFELAHPEFVFYPTWEHQQRDQLQPEFQRWFDELQPGDPSRLTITATAKAVGVIEAPADPARWQRARELHVWSDSYIDMRYGYRPDLPLRIVLLRVSRLASAVEISADKRYGGCRSWVELNGDIPLGGSEPTLSDERFLDARQRLCSALEVNLRAPGK